MPIVWTVVLAFQRVRLVDLRRTGLFGDCTLDNFDRVLHTPGFCDRCGPRCVYTRRRHRGSILLGLVAALALRRPFRGRAWCAASMLLPYVAPVVAVTFVWEVVLDPQFGIVNDWGSACSAGTSRSPFLGRRSPYRAGSP